MSTANRPSDPSPLPRRRKPKGLSPERLAHRKERAAASPDEGTAGADARTVPANDSQMLEEYPGWREKSEAEEEAEVVGGESFIGKSPARNRAEALEAKRIQILRNPPGDIKGYPYSQDLPVEHPDFMNGLRCILADAVERILEDQAPNVPDYLEDLRRELQTGVTSLGELRATLAKTVHLTSFRALELTEHPPETAGPVLSKRSIDDPKRHAPVLIKHLLETVELVLNTEPGGWRIAESAIGLGRLHERLRMEPYERPALHGISLENSRHSADSPEVKAMAYALYWEARGILEREGHRFRGRDAGINQNLLSAVALHTPCPSLTVSALHKWKKQRNVAETLEGVRKLPEFTEKLTKVLESLSMAG